MINSCMFDKKYIIEWENVSNKTYTHTTYFFELLADDEDIYTSVVGGTAKKTRFESAQNTREHRQPAAALEQRDDAEISNNKRI